MVTRKKKGLGMSGGRKGEKETRWQPLDGTKI